MKNKIVFKDHDDHPAVGTIPMFDSSTFFGQKAAPKAYVTANLRFVHAGPSPSGKTATFSVLAARNESYLGCVKWYGAWRKYVFFPWTQTLFDPVCLRQIAIFCETLTKKHNDRKT